MMHLTACEFQLTENIIKRIVHLIEVVKNLKTLVNGHFATNAKMVLINDDQCDIANIVLGVWLKVKKLNHPSSQYDWGG